MPNVLTTSSKVTCGHTGRVTTFSTVKLRVNNARVLLKSGVDRQAVSSCTTPPASDASGPTAVACTLVTSAPGGVPPPPVLPSGVTLGEARKLTAGGQPVMLDTLAGSTNGMVAKTTPQTLLAATALQTKLTAR